MSTLQEKPIANIKSYNTAMMQSMVDKMFFMDKIDADVIVDFGCADGTMLAYINKFFPDKQYVGYDINEEMIAIAKSSVVEHNIEFTSDFEAVKQWIQDKRSAIVLSSVIHEVYSYGPSQVEHFWKELFALKPDYIIIRDMNVSRTASRPSDPITVARVKQLYDRERLEQFESEWGSIDDNWSLTHFLLKYRYVQNWDREVHENYLPINKEKLLQQFPKEYFPHFIEHFTLPFLRQQVLKDFNFDLQEKTHLKLIMRKVKI